MRFIFKLLTEERGHSLHDAAERIRGFRTLYEPGILHEDNDIQLLILPRMTLPDNAEKSGPYFYMDPAKDFDDLCNKLKKMEQEHPNLVMDYYILDFRMIKKTVDDIIDK